MMVKNAVQNVAQNAVTPSIVQRNGHFSLEEDTVFPRMDVICGADRSMVDALRFVCPVA